MEKLGKHQRREFEDEIQGSYKTQKRIRESNVSSAQKAFYDDLDQNMERSDAIQRSLLPGEAYIKLVGQNNYLTSDSSGTLFIWLITPELATSLNSFSLSGGLFPTYVARMVQLADIYAEYSIDRFDIHIRQPSYVHPTLAIYQSAFTMGLCEDISKLPTATADANVVMDLIEPEVFNRSDAADLSIDYGRMTKKNRVREFIPTKLGSTVNYEYLNYTSNPVPGVVISAYSSSNNQPYCSVTIEAYVRFRGFQQL